MLCGGVTVLWAEPTVSRPLNWLNTNNNNNNNVYLIKRPY